MFRVLRSMGVLAVLIATLAASFPAAAHSRTSVSIGVGAVFGPGPYYYRPHYYPPVYYYPPPVYYYPPPVYYVPPPPVVYAPPPAVVYPPPSPAAYTPAPAPAPAQNAYCREYRGNATIDGSNQPFFGTACLQTDGKWHIVN